VGELSLHFPSYANNPEDRWFRWAVIASVIIHSLVFLEPEQPETGMAAQARHSAIDVSLSFLQQQSILLIDETSVLKKQVEEKILVKQNLLVTEAKSKARSKRVVEQNITAERNRPVRAVKVTAPNLARHIVRGTGQQTVTVSEQYLSKLLIHIESYKYYPRVAQRREIEGVVTVSFRMLRDGVIENLRVSGAHLILQKAAESAVQQALPMLPAPEKMRLPFEVSFVMQFQLPGA